jgi:hypothetical protein
MAAARRKRASLPPSASGQKENPPISGLIII